MLPWILRFFAVALFYTATESSSAKEKSHVSPHRLPVVYVFTVVPAVCAKGLPSYIKVSLEQAIFTQPDCDVVLLSNFKECNTIRESVSTMEGLILIDSNEIESNRTHQFKNSSSEMFNSDGMGELWVTSALRFFMMEDLMITKNYVELMHVEADNLLYGRFTSLLPTLRTRYKSLAATPLNINLSFITASVLWIHDLRSIVRFNDYLLELGTPAGWKAYMDWLHPYACCRPDGSIRPFAVNEMSMLGHYHHLRPQEFELLPVLPEFNYIPHRYIKVNRSAFMPGGMEVGAPLGVGIWDPNSWGQYIGGTSSKKGRDKGFTDASHIAGMGIRGSGCRVFMMCGNSSFAGYYTTTAANLGGSSGSGGGGRSGCYTAPFVRCADDYPWTPLYNLHVHSKHTQNFRSLPCDCIV